MGRKRSRTSVKSKGSMNSVSKNTKRMIRADNKADLMRTMLNKLDAWKKGKRVILHDEEGKRVDAKTIWGNPNKKFTIGRKI
tara:strand:+ start:308 stop:553 length:246 start_codon:yes stop_codon:yes gene_type:complete